MKKLFTVLAISVAGLASINLSARNTPSFTRTSAGHITLPAIHSTTPSGSRAVGCDTLINLDFSTADSSLGILPLAPQNLGVGYLDGNGALNFGNGPMVIKGIGEEFTAPLGLNNRYATYAIVAFTHVRINAADSNNTVTAYIYDTLGTSVYGGVGPGHAVDSATTTLKDIASFNGVGLFQFTHQAQFGGRNFFVTVSLPQVAGDTLVVLINDATQTGNGRGYVNIPDLDPASTGWVSYDSLSQGTLRAGHLIYVAVCGDAITCPTITATATQVGTLNKATVTATGGAAPYAFQWSSTPAQNTDTATGLTYGQTYTVTATDANGCTGTGTVTLGPNGINDIPGLSRFSVYPNPSNGSFTVALSMESASDVTISVVDVTGAKVYEATEKSAKDVSKPINLSNIAPGVYVLNVKTANGSTNQLISVK